MAQRAWSTQEISASWSCVRQSFFFFSSRRRHTRFDCDWSSDVCSSDLVTRTINGPARIVFEAFTKAELLKRWWVPKSMGMTLLSCEVDARIGGTYRLVFDHGGPEPAAFFGTYVEVKPYSRLAWTNDEGGEGGPVTTVTFEEKGGKTLVVLRESYPSKEALDAAGTGAADAMGETSDQLDELIVALGESSGQ